MKKSINSSFLTLIISLFILGPISNPSYGEQINPTNLNSDSSLYKDNLYEDDLYGEDDLYEDDDSDEKDQATSIADPIAGFNKAMFYFNDKVYIIILHPLARVYGFILPKPVRKAVARVFNNLEGPLRIVNCLLQAKVKKSGQEFLSFLVNSTIGIAGIFDPASKLFSWTQQDEDFGQTLGYYGIGHGFYITLPFLGPSSLRDGVGTILDAFLDPLKYILEDELRFITKPVKILNRTSLNINQYHEFKKAALDPYLAFRDFYAQYRKKQVED